MMIVKPLSFQEIQTLEEMHKNDPSHTPRIRAHAILLVVCLVKRWHRHAHPNQVENNHRDSYADCANDNANDNG